MNQRRILDWRFLAMLTVMVVVVSFCYSAVKRVDQADNLIRIAEDSAAQSARNGREVAKLRAELDKQTRTSGVAVVRIQQQNRAQRRQIDLLVRYLRANGLDVPRIEVPPPAPDATPSPRRSTKKTTPNVTKDQPGRSDDRRATSKKPKNPRKGR